MEAIWAILGLAAVAAMGVLLLRASAKWLIGVGLCFAVFAGQWAQMGLPIGLDRILIAAGLFSLLVGVERRNRVLRVRFRSEHAVMIVLGVYATVSSLIAATLFSGTEGAFALLDRLSITAFILFTVSPLIFHDRRSRNALHRSGRPILRRPGQLRRVHPGRALQPRGRLQRGAAVRSRSL